MSEDITIALADNSNSGETTVFNNLTCARQSMPKRLLINSVFGKPEARTCSVSPFGKGGQWGFPSTS